MSKRDWHVSGRDTQSGLAEASEPFFTSLTQGTMRFLVFAPLDVDAQKPHHQDELYIVSRGISCFVRNGDRVSVEVGDALFVPAGMAHHFEQMSNDFETWVVFWGPQGGELQH